MDSKQASARDFSLDNIRFFLIFSVVFAHLLEVCAPFRGSNLLYQFIYVFHMPAFLFLFGYNVRYSPKKIVYRWCIPYIVVQSGYILFSKYVLNSNMTLQYTKPYWLLWYMLVCIFYQLLLPLFDTESKPRQVFVLTCTFILALLVGFENSIGYTMSLSRFFVFQPCFLLGYYCKKNGFPASLAVHKNLRYILTAASAAIALLAVPLLYYVKLPSGLLYGSYPYASCGGTWWMRGLVLLISFSGIFFVFLGLKPLLNRKIFLLTEIGQNTWPIFLLHGAIVKAAPVYLTGFLTSPWLVLLLSAAVLILLGNKFAGKAIYYGCFSWLERFPKERSDR